jgi:hypothetical protein
MLGGSDSGAGSAATERAVTCHPWLFGGQFGAAGAGLYVPGGCLVRQHMQPVLAASCALFLQCFGSGVGSLQRL